MPVYLPYKINQWSTSTLNSTGITLSSFCSTKSTFLPIANLVRLDTLKMWVSTAILGQPKDNKGGCVTLSGIFFQQMFLVFTLQTNQRYLKQSDG